MIKVINKEDLDDDFILRVYTDNIDINDKLTFLNDYIYYFGNYKESKLNIIEHKLIKNKKNIIKAIEKGAKFLIYGNSIDIFNNSFNHKKLNLFTVYDYKNVKFRKNKIIFKNKYSNYIKNINSLNETSDSINFRYKNLICFNNKNIFKKQSISTLLHEL